MCGRLSCYHCHKLPFQCSVVINVIFNTCFGSIVCYIGEFYFEDFLNYHFELFGEMYENYRYSTCFSFKLCIINVLKITR
jgi:hypothetical protein